MMRPATLRGAVACLAAALFSTTAEAQLFRAYLASDGSDASPCTLQAPCRLLPAALNAVASGGEIWMLDSANYNTATVNITKSVSILAVPGVVGSVVATGGPAISISIPGLTVALRNLVIAPVVTMPAGTHGVLMTGASNLTIEDSLIANLTGDGAHVEGAGMLNVSNTTFRSNGFAAMALRGGAAATVSGTRMLANLGGVSAAPSPGSVTVTSASIIGSIISGRSGSYGAIASTGDPGSIARISVTRSTIEGTQYALRSVSGTGGPAEVIVGGSMIVDNTYAWYQQGIGAAILSLGNNQMSGNNTSVGVLTPLAPQ